MHGHSARTYYYRTESLVFCSSQLLATLPTPTTTTAHAHTAHCTHPHTCTSMPTLHTPTRRLHLHARTHAAHRPRLSARARASTGRCRLRRVPRGSSPSGSGNMNGGVQAACEQLQPERRRPERRRPKRLSKRLCLLRCLTCEHSGKVKVVPKWKSQDGP